MQNYGECLSGDRAADTYFEEGEQLLFMAPTQPKPLLGCVDNEMNQCAGNNLECAGQENSNYVYSLSDGRLTFLLINQLLFERMKYIISRILDNFDIVCFI